MAGPAKRARAESAVALPPASPPSDVGGNAPEDSAAGGANGAAAAAATVPVDWTTLPYDVAVLVAKSVLDIYTGDKRTCPGTDALEDYLTGQNIPLGFIHNRKGREALFALSRARAGPLSEAACALLFRPMRAPGGGGGGGGGGTSPCLLDKYRHETVYSARHALSAKPLSKFSLRSPIPSVRAPWNARWDAATRTFVRVPVGWMRQLFNQGFGYPSAFCTCTSVPCDLMNKLVPSCTTDNPFYEYTDMLVVVRSAKPSGQWRLKHVHSVTRPSDGTWHFVMDMCSRDGPEYANTYVGSRWTAFRADGRTAMVFSGAAERMFAAMKKEQRACRAARRAQERPQPVRKRARRE